MLSNDEIRAYQEKYEKNHAVYGRVSDYIFMECYEYKRGRPKSIRAVFSREPVVKAFAGVINKIEDKRINENPNYGYDDLPDLIALTVLCAYRSDVLDFIRWLRNSFDVRTHDEEALRDNPQGHRGYHYVVRVRPDVVRAHTEYRGINCEIQVKTILEEAFDAKSHDFTYKPGGRLIPPEVQQQFGILSSSLRAIDQYSEFLKDLILAEEREIELRREASILLCLKNEEAMGVARELTLDFDTVGGHDIAHIVQKFDSSFSSNGVSRGLCRCVAACGLKLNDDFLKDEAIRYATMLVGSSPSAEWPYRLRASVNWTLGRFEEAIEDIGIAIELAPDAVAQKRTKNSFVYFVTDWKCVKKQEKQAWSDRAANYVTELSSGVGEPILLDTLGYYYIIFGRTAEEVERGRKLLGEAREQAPLDKLRATFFKHHECIALKRLLTMINQDYTA
jgi:ppGpp synthetase/RelA/SpoT-type nucleotidyltranferase